MSAFSSTSKPDISRLFWVLFALHVIGWTLIPALTQHNAPLDVIEGFAWGREWPLGTYKHPPLQAWLLECAYQIFKTSPIGYYALSALCTGKALWAVYRTGRLLVGKTEGLIAAALAQAIVYFNFLSPEFNPNVLMLVLWAVGGYAFAHALIRNKPKYWLLLGVVFAAGFYAKYTMGILALSFGLFLLMQPEARKKLATPWPYIAVALTALLFAPHVKWLVEHNFLPFSYAAERAEPAKNIAEHFLFPLRFTLSQLACLAPALIAALALLWPVKKEALDFRDLKSSLVPWLAFAPLAIVLIASLLTGEKLRDMWGMPFLTFIPLWLVSFFAIRPRWKCFATVWAALFVIGLAAYGGNQLYATRLGYKPLRGHFPGPELAESLATRWQDKTHAPLTTIIGDAWMAGNAAFYTPLPTRPHVWIDGSTQTSQWIDPAQVKTQGAILVWRGDEKPAWLAKFPSARMGSSFPLAWHADTKAAPLLISWAWLPPQTVAKATTR